MTTIETVKYQNDYTGEMFDDYGECFDSEIKFMFSKDHTGIITVFDNGKIGDISEVFSRETPSGLQSDRIDAIIFPSAEAAHEFINNFKYYWYEVNGTEPEPFNPDVCDDKHSDTLTFIPSINADDVNYPSFICAAEVKLIISSFRQDMELAEKAKIMVDNSDKE